MLIAPPREIRKLVTYEGDYEFTLDETASEEQKKIFDEWIELVREMKRNLWGEDD